VEDIATTRTGSGSGEIITETGAKVKKIVAVIDANKAPAKILQRRLQFESILTKEDLGIKD